MLKDTAFLTLLKVKGYNPENVGFMKDRYGRRGASCKATFQNKEYAVWFMQKDYPTGIYALAITSVQLNEPFPLFKYIGTRNVDDVFDFVDKLNNGFDDSVEKAEKIGFPWKELSNRILKV